MRFLVVGPGAMGCLFGARLKKAGFDVILLDYKKKRAQQIAGDGIKVYGVTGEYTVKVPVVTDDSFFVPDFVLICVKAYQTVQAAQSIKTGPASKAVIVTLQNGLGNVEILESIFGKKKVLGGVTAEGATLLGPGKIRHAGRGETIIGSKIDSVGSLKKLVSAFNMADFKTRSSENVNNLIWGKLIINVGINALTAITRLKNGRLAELTGTKTIMEAAVKEAVQVAEAKNITLPYPDPVGRVIEVCNATAENIASMLQDVLKEKITEVDYINGAIVKEGRATDISTPVNSTLTALVKTIEETYKEKVVGGV